MQDLPRHRHSDPRLSVSFQSQTRWMAGEWKSWLKPNPIPLLPSTVREHPSILFATTLMPERATTPALFHTSFSYHPLLYLSLSLSPSLRTFHILPKIQIYIYILCLSDNNIYNFAQFCIFICKIMLQSDSVAIQNQIAIRQFIVLSDL